MINIREWSQEEAENKFHRIESCKTEEWYDVEWKRELCFEDTNLKTNTTQRVVSGFANTFGGVLVVGFNDNGILLGIEEMDNIENHFFAKLEKKISPEVPFFKAKYYEYAGKKVLVIFVQPSKAPLRCDNGVYYYREQSEFRPMPHIMLENKFRRCFDDEKYLYLLRIALESLHDFSHFKMGQGPTVSYKLNHFQQMIQTSGEKLYQLLKENNLLALYSSLLTLINFFVGSEGDGLKTTGDFGTLKFKANALLESLKSIK